MDQDVKTAPPGAEQPPKENVIAEERSNAANIGAALAEAIMLGNDTDIVHIGEKAIVVKPLNMFALKSIWGTLVIIAKAIFASRRVYLEQLSAYVNAREAYKVVLADKDATVEVKEAAKAAMTENDLPFSEWWMEPLTQVFDDIVTVVVAVLKRSDDTITEAFVQENLEPLPFFGEFLPVFARQNKLDAIVKKLAGSASAPEPELKQNTESQTTSA